MIEFPSGASLLVRVCRADGGEIGTATGFLVHHGERRWLVTNAHVVTGLDPLTGAWLADRPQKLEVGFRLAGAIPQTFVTTPRNAIIDLYDERGDPVWLEHPRYRESVDVVAIAIDPSQGVDGFAHDLSAPSPGLLVGVGRPVHIVGFPFGLTTEHNMAVWTTGFIASEPDSDYGGLPRFLVDARTRPGQSGSPVIIYDAAGSIALQLGGRSPVNEARQQLLGVYASRIHKEADIGVVWKVSVLSEIIEGGRRPGNYAALED